ncbi:MAG TPA: vanadium-dependent haloperoxidase [Chitinophagaceae bacterium]|nr:vanadium-dependent haloperoxidase [Chitinophagaceae bacterium]
MKKNFLSVAIIFFTITLFIASCQKEIDQQAKQEEVAAKANNNNHGHLKQTNTYSSDAVIKWMEMQLRLMRTATGIPNNAFTRPYAYSGIALYETVVSGMPAYQSLASQLNGLSGLPQTEPGFAYHWPSSANAALAYINKNMFPTTSAANKTSIDSLENALNTQYQGEVDAETINRSVALGKAVAQKIFEWAQTDGNLHASDSYTPPTGEGLWVPTAPAFAAASTPYWGNLRTIVPGSGDNAQPAAPTPYSTDPSSDFYKMAKQVYDVSQTLTAEQTAMALYWRDVPGVTTPGHYVSILKQVLENDKPMLDKAAIAYALGGITAYDAAISCWQTKYHYNLVRPITYIRTILGHTTWNPLLTTPAHPEYSSAHAVLSAATADVFSNLFGDNYSFTDHTYDYLGMAPRSFNSFRAFGEDAGNSRLYAGIHYQASIDIGLMQGRKVAQNIINKLKFFKE